MCYPHSLLLEVSSEQFCFLFYFFSFYFSFYSSRPFPFFILRHWKSATQLESLKGIIPASTFHSLLLSLSLSLLLSLALSLFLPLSFSLSLFLMAQFFNRIIPQKYGKLSNVISLGINKNTMISFYAWKIKQKYNSPIFVMLCHSSRPFSENYFLLGWILFYSRLSLQSISKNALFKNKNDV